VRADWLGQPGASGDAANDPPGTVPVQPLPGGGQENRALAAFADRQVDRPRSPRRERDHGLLAALTDDRQGAVPALHAQRLDVRADSFRHPQPVERQQRNQSMLGRAGQPGCHQNGAGLVAVQADRMGLAGQPRPPDMGGGRVVEQAFLHGVFAEPGDRGQPPRHRGPGPAAGLQVTGEAFDVRPAGCEQGDAMLVAPGGELA
jgi:hypothetical protein